MGLNYTPLDDLLPSKWSAELPKRITEHELSAIQKKSDSIRDAHKKKYRTCGVRYHCIGKCWGESITVYFRLMYWQSKKTIKKFKYLFDRRTSEWILLEEY